MRWLKSGKLLSDEHMLIYSGDNKEHKHEVRMLSNSKWGSNTTTVGTTALALSFSAGECACPVWA